MGYLANFIVYTLAMVGVMMIAVFVFKNSTAYSSKSGGKLLKVTDTLSLGARKTLYIVSAGEEKFLIAGDVDRTSLIAKLNQEEKLSTKTLENYSVGDDIRTQLQKNRNNYIDKSIIGINSTGLNTRGLSPQTEGSVLKSLATRIRGGE